MIGRLLDAFLRNLRRSGRALSRSPGFTVTVVLTLAFALGANSSVFSAMDAILLRPLALPDSHRLVHVSQYENVIGETRLAPVRLEDWNELNSTFDAITGYFAEDVSDTTGDLPAKARWAAVSPRFFDVWGVPPSMGRPFNDEEYAQGSTIVVVSDRYWRSRFGADPNVLDRTVRIGDRSYAIIGVMPPSFMFPDREVDIWYPNFTGYAYAQRRERTLYVGVGRLKPGVSLDAARADLEVVQRQLAEQYPDTDSAIGVRIEPLKQELVGEYSDSLWLLLGGVLVLLLIACTNVAALLLSRAARRERDAALQYSLGASRITVAGQGLTETALLVFAGALLGLLVATIASFAFRNVVADVPRLDQVGIDSRTFLYTLGIAVIVTFLCGLVPAVRRSRGFTSLLPGTSRSQVSTGNSPLWWLVCIQVTLSVVLLAGAGLLLRSFQELSRVELGFEPARVLTFHISAGSAEATDFERVVQRINGTLDELEALPGIEAAATALMLPGLPGENPGEFELATGRAASEPAMIAESRVVSPSSFDTLGIPIVAGELCRRPLNNQDRRSDAEAMVNRSFAARYFPSRSILGLELTRPEFFVAPNVRVVGIVADARELGMHREPPPTVYTCDSAPSPFPWYLVRTSGAPETAAQAIRAKLNELEPLRAVYDIQPLEERMAEAYAQNRLRMRFLIFFAVAALALAGMGIYGTLSYVISLRQREIGLRVAIGALSRSIVARFLIRTLSLVGFACVMGLVLSMAFARLLSSMLYGVAPTDPTVILGVVLLILVVAAAAAIFPSMRAARVNPATALRGD